MMTWHTRSQGIINSGIDLVILKHDGSTFWGLKTVADISQETFSNLFSWKEIVGYLIQNYVYF